MSSPANHGVCAFSFPLQRMRPSLPWKLEPWCVCKTTKGIDACSQRLPLYGTRVLVLRDRRFFPLSTVLYRAHQSVKYKSKGGLPVGGLANTPNPSWGLSVGGFAKHFLPHLDDEEIPVWLSRPDNRGPKLFNFAFNNFMTWCKSGALSSFSPNCALKLSTSGEKDKIISLPGYSRILLRFPPGTAHTPPEILRRWAKMKISHTGVPQDSKRSKGWC